LNVAGRGKKGDVSLRCLGCPLPCFTHASLVTLATPSVHTLNKVQRRRDMCIGVYLERASKFSMKIRVCHSGLKSIEICSIFL
jgi:hypothetical protein